MLPWRPGQHGSTTAKDLGALFTSTAVASSSGGRTGDYQAIQPGPDFWVGRLAVERQKMWQILEEQKPDVVIMSPDCRMFSQLMNVNLERIPIERLTRDQMQALVMWQLCLQVADYQLQRGRSFVLEQPGGASSWQTHGAQWLSKQDQVHHFLFDQCELGLRVTPTGLSRKTTGLMTNHLGVAFLLSQYQCTKSHGHVPLESGLPSWTASLEAHQSLLDVVLADEDDDEDMGERQPRTPGTLHRDSSESLTVEQKKKIELLHCNMGHLSRDQMLLMLRAANAKEGVLKYVRDRFQCSSCMRQRKPVERRLAAVPRTFAFNRLFFPLLLQPHLCFLECRVSWNQLSASWTPEKL